VVIHNKMLVFGGSASNEMRLAFNDLFALDIGHYCPYSSKQLPELLRWQTVKPGMPSKSQEVFQEHALVTRCRGVNAVGTSYSMVVTRILEA